MNFVCRYPLRYPKPAGGQDMSEPEDLKLLIWLDNPGERAGTRTLDPLIKSQMLYRLSYALPSQGALQYRVAMQGSSAPNPSSSPGAVSIFARARLFPSPAATTIKVL